MYTLYNKYTNQYLVHPKLGIWQTANEEEAKEMLELAIADFKAMGYTWLEGKIVISNVEENS